MYIIYRVGQISFTEVDIKLQYIRVQRPLLVNYNQRIKLSNPFHLSFDDY